MRATRTTLHTSSGSGRTGAHRRPPEVTSTAGHSGLWWRGVAAVEVVAAAIAVVSDWLIPAAVLVVMATVSLLVRRRCPARWGSTVPLTLFGWSVRWRCSPPHGRCSTWRC